MKIGINLEDVQAEMLREILLADLSENSENTGIFNMLQEGNYVQITNSKRSKVVALLPSSIFTTSFLNYSKIEVNLKATIELYSSTQYPKGFKALLNMFVNDIVERLGEWKISRRCFSVYPTDTGSVVISDDRDWVMEFLEFIPMHFKGLIEEPGIDDVDFILDISPVFKVC
nr:MAG TPA: hypothetical protein [Caudoviricetes sp.]